MYEPFGNPIYRSGTPPTDKGFTGQRTDATSGLDYFNARYYDPTGRVFASADTVRDGQNPYAYVHWNPETNTDPSGNCPWCIAAVVGAVAGAAISYGSQVASNVQHGGSLTDGSTWTHVDGGAILKAALVGAIIGATGGAAGAALAGGIGTLGLSGAAAVGVEVGAGAALGAGEGAGGQILSNVTNGQQWSDGVGQAALFGAATGGAGAAAERRWRGGGRVQRCGHAADTADVGAAGEFCSFAFNTPVATPSGEQAIGTLQVGDQVSAYDPSSGKTARRRCSMCWSTTTPICWT